MKQTIQNTTDQIARMKSSHPQKMADYKAKRNQEIGNLREHLGNLKKVCHKISFT